MRHHIATQFGVILPEMRLTDDASLLPGEYVIKIQGVERARDILRPNQVLMLLSDALDPGPQGEDVREPVYQAPARWITADMEEEAALNGNTVVSPTEVLATHLLEVVKANFSRLLSLRALRKLLDEMVNLTDTSRGASNRKMLDELVPDKVPVDLLLTVLRLLLEERVSIRNMPVILEAIAEARGAQITPEGICEHVRQRLGFQLVAEMKRPDGTVPLVQLSPAWEETFIRHQIDNERGGSDVALPPDVFNGLANALAEKIGAAGEVGVFPAVVTSTKRRRYLRTILSAKGLSNPVLSFEEIGMEARPSIVGLVPA